MTDRFTSLWEQCQKEARAERTASERVTTLRPDMEPRQRVRFALQAIADGVAQLEMIAGYNEDMLNGAQIDALDDIDSRLALLRPRVKMRRSMLHLTSEMGRAP